MSPLATLLFVAAFALSICNLPAAQVDTYTVIIPDTSSSDEYMPFTEGNVEPDPLPFEATIEHAFILGTPEEVEDPPLLYPT